ncbi:hypothetical protein NKR23_g5288 [Pleurostoma richardsiae]|uniref:Uncharacterized protein n=1 Tax=Pleurostoma richardsiae TaxID=41990 RepID=A0AA38RDN6_9PEZI|nr:hypothetical protein NKR23_g5288 [Pleurostoma richardsiae]
MSRKPRERTMPLIPEPFDILTVSKQSLYRGSEPIANKWRVFCPNLNVPQYTGSLSEEKKLDLNERADKLFKRAMNNHVSNSSEFRWEVCAWHDVFGLILDDEGLRMDKRHYEFVEKDKKGRRTVRTRIPDATLGLKTYDDYELKRGHVYEAKDRKEDSSSRQPDERLSKVLLRTMMDAPDRGLIVDGMWGKTDIIFPFAVYEAKRQFKDYQAAENQIYHACKTYLAMLDDLARDPNNVAEYQTEESSQYQLFAFTSCGPYWEVYIAWNFLDSCTVESIWVGDVKEFDCACALVCIVDQIHEYVINHHRPFVMKHLEAWLRRRRKSPNPPGSLTHLADAEASKNTSYTNDYLTSDDSGSFQSVFRPFSEEPEWLRLKEKTKLSRKRKARETRVHNRKLGYHTQTGSSDKVKRGFGDVAEKEAVIKRVLQ